MGRKKNHKKAKKKITAHTKLRQKKRKPEQKKFIYIYRRKNIYNKYKF